MFCTFIIKFYQRSLRIVIWWSRSISSGVLESVQRITIDFFGLDSSIMSWQFHPEKNFLCLYKPVKFCLSKNKGSTRDPSSVDYDDELADRYPQLKIWRRAYRHQMIKIYERIFQCESHKECCKKPKTAIGPNRVRLAHSENIDEFDKSPERWRWLRKYYCDEDFFQ